MVQFTHSVFGDQTGHTQINGKEAEAAKDLFLTAMKTETALTRIKLYLTRTQKKLRTTLATKMRFHILQAQKNRIMRFLPVQILEITIQEKLPRKAILLATAQVTAQNLESLRKMQ